MSQSDEDLPIPRMQMEQVHPDRLLLLLLSTNLWMVSEIQSETWRDALVVGFLDQQEQLILFDFNLVGRLGNIVVGCFEYCNILFVTHGLGNIGRQFGVAQISRPTAPLSALM
jgi:hypothetical protein